MKESGKRAWRAFGTAGCGHARRAVLAALLLFACLWGGFAAHAAEAGGEDREKKTADVSAAKEDAGLAGMKGKTFAVADGAVFDQLVSAAIGDAQFLYYSNVADEVMALENGKVDAIALDEPVARLLAAQNPRVRIMEGYVYADDAYGLGLAKDSRFTEQVNEIIRRFREDGTLEDMARRWFSGDEAQMAIPEDLRADGNNGVLRYVHGVTTKPMCYSTESGAGTGYEVELVQRIACELDMELSLVQADLSALIPMLVSGKADIVSNCMSITEERKKSIDMSESYYTGGVVLVVLNKDGGNGAAGEKKGFVGALKDSFYNNFVKEMRWKLLAGGLGVTLVISACAGCIGMALGFGLCMIRRSGPLFFRRAAAGFVRAIQGTPVLVLLMLIYYVVFGGVDIPSMAAAIIGFSINFAVYVSEMMKTGIESVDPGQTEAALALGYTGKQAFMKIVMPQAARHFLPVVKGEFISMVKMTSVVGYIAIQDLTKASDIIRSRTYEAFFPLIVTAVLYFLASWLAASLIGRVEISLDPKRRREILKGVNMH